MGIYLHCQAVFKTHIQGEGYLDLRHIAHGALKPLEWFAGGFETYGGRSGIEPPIVFLSNSKRRSWVGFGLGAIGMIPGTLIAVVVKVALLIFSSHYRAQHLAVVDVLVRERQEKGEKAIAEKERLNSSLSQVLQQFQSPELYTLTDEEYGRDLTLDRYDPVMGARKVVKTKDAKIFAFRCAVIETTMQAIVILDVSSEAKEISFGSYSCISHHYLVVLNEPNRFKTNLQMTFSAPLLTDFLQGKNVKVPFFFSKVDSHGIVHHQYDDDFVHLQRV
jgi:hypothetical protein